MSLTLQPLRRLFFRAGAKRVSDKAAFELSKYIEYKTNLLIKEAQKLSEYSGRKTILKSDIRLAKKILEK